MGKSHGELLVSVIPVKISVWLLFGPATQRNMRSMSQYESCAEIVVIE
jgi:hypothetical protein